MLFGFILIVVVMKFTAPRIDETPAKCNEKIARSTEAPAWAIPLARGGVNSSSCSYPAFYCTTSKKKS